MTKKDKTKTINFPRNSMVAKQSKIIPSFKLKFKYYVRTTMCAGVCGGEFKRKKVAALYRTQHV